MLLWNKVRNIRFFMTVGMGISWAISVATRLPGFWTGSLWLSVASLVLLVGGAITLVHWLQKKAPEVTKSQNILIPGWAVALLALSVAIALSHPIPFPVVAGPLRGLWRPLIHLTDIVVYSTLILGAGARLKKSVEFHKLFHRKWWQVFLKGAFLLMASLPLLMVGRYLFLEKPTGMLRLQAFWIVSIGIVLVAIIGKYSGTRLKIHLAKNNILVSHRLGALPVKGLFLLFPIVLFYGLLGYKLLPADSRYMKQQKFENLSQKESIEIFYMGSSHASSINPNLIQRVGFNFTMDANPLYYDWIILERNISKAPDLKLVIQTISVFTPVLDTKTVYGAGARSIYCWFFLSMGILPDHERLSFFLANPICQPVALYGIEKSLNLAVNGFPENAIFDNNGWRRVENPSKNFDEYGKAQAQKVGGFWKNIQKIPENTQYLQNIFQLTQKHGIRLVLVTTPSDDSFRRYYPDDLYSQYQQWIQSFVSKNSIPYFDYYADPQFSREDFVNPDHLNENGIKKFSQIIERDIVRKYLPE